MTTTITFQLTGPNAPAIRHAAEMKLAEVLGLASNYKDGDPWPDLLWGFDVDEVYRQNKDSYYGIVTDKDNPVIGEFTIKTRSATPESPWMPAAITALLRERLTTFFAKDLDKATIDLLTEALITEGWTPS